MRITISTAPARIKPHVGDRKMIRGVEHVREFKKCHDARGNPIGYDCTGGRQNYVWVPVK